MKAKKIKKPEKQQCNIHDVSGAKRNVCPICWQPLEDGIVQNMCVNDDCPTNGGRTYR